MRVIALGQVLRRGTTTERLTIEVANDEIGGDWHVSDAAFNKLIELCVDICQRNNFRLSFDGTKRKSNDA